MKTMEFGDHWPISFQITKLDANEINTSMQSVVNLMHKGKPNEVYAEFKLLAVKAALAQNPKILLKHSQYEEVIKYLESNNLMDSYLISCRIFASLGKMTFYRET